MKRLEGEKKPDELPAAAAAAAAPTAAPAVAQQPVQDTRTLEELLSFIGEDPVLHKAQQEPFCRGENSSSKGRKARQKTKGKGSRARERVSPTWLMF